MSGYHTNSLISVAPHSLGVDPCPRARSMVRRDLSSTLYLRGYKIHEGVLPLVSNTGRLVTMDKKKAEVLNNFFCFSLLW